MNVSNELASTTGLLANSTSIMTQTFQKFSEALKKSIHIKLDGDTLDNMKNSNYKMCFAKKVGDFDYNVVWQSYNAYLESNVFSWTPMYSIFGSNEFLADIQVSVSCSPVEIGIGMTTTLSNNGRLSHPITGGSQTAFTMINEFGAIHPGVNQLSTGLDGKQISNPIYVAEKPAITGKIELMPVEKVLIWFEQNISTGTMFSSARSREKEVDLTNKNEIHLLYDGNWKEIN